MQIIGKYKPQSLLDVGCGFGVYGFLCRHYFDATFGRFQPKDFQIQIDGIEIYEPYISDLQHLIYTTLYIGDAFEILDDLGNYDEIICIGVLEHFPKEKGYQLLEKFFQHTNVVVIATPYPDCWEAQGAWYGNENERHIAKWLPQDFNKYINTQTIIIPDYIIELSAKRKIGIGIVAYGNTELLELTIDSLKKTTTVEHELAIFDNSPANSVTRSYLEKRDDFTLLKNENFITQLPDGWSNAGGAFGKNRLIEYFMRNYEFILLVDSDVEFLPGCLEKMLSAVLSNKDAGYVGCPQANAGFAVREGLTEELASICNLTRSEMWQEVGLYPECLMYYSYDSWHSTLANMYGWRTYQLEKDYYIHHAHGSTSNEGVKTQAEHDCRLWAETEAKWEAYWKKRFEKGKGKIYE